MEGNRGKDFYDRRLGIYLSGKAHWQCRYRSNGLAMLLNEYIGVDTRPPV